jgi:hypothetical protein
VRRAEDCFKATMGCTEGPIQSWIDWQDSSPADPRELFANAMVLGVQGVYTDSSTFATPPVPSTLLKVVGARVIDSIGPTSRAILTNPITTQVVGVLDHPDRIEIDFNVSPDPLSITTFASILVTGLTTGPVGGGVAVVVGGGKTARLTFPAALAAGDTYIVNINGTTAPAVTFGGIALDGEALALPSGNGVAGGDFCFGVEVVAGSKPAPPAAAPLPTASNWNPSLLSIGALPTCSALESDNKERVANAAQWNFTHITAMLDVSTAPALTKELFLRAGEEWQNNLVLNLGYLKYTEIALSLSSNAGTRGDCQGTIPVIRFIPGTTFAGQVTLAVTLKKKGKYNVGIRAIDTNGYYSMYGSIWNVVD